MLVIGVDPGLSGAVCLLDSARGLLECEDLPTCGNGLASGSMKRWIDVPGLEALISRWYERWELSREAVAVAIERPIAMPSLPAQTIASQFDTFGVVRAVLARRAAPQYVEPREWKKLFGFGKDKDEARACCLRLYPGAPVSRVKDHNRAESILIGHWLMRRMA